MAALAYVVQVFSACIRTPASKICHGAVAYCADKNMAALAYVV